MFKENYLLLVRSLSVSERLIRYYRRLLHMFSNEMLYYLYE